MAGIAKISQWLDIRPGEGRSVALSVLGAFLLLAALTLGRSLREALYLGRFAAGTLPYITVAVVGFNLPLVALFIRLLGRYSPRRVVLALGLIQAAGLVPLWLVGQRHPTSGPAIVAFYLWTALGILLLASGFWVVTADYFAVRGAKRLFGFISAGGTAGAMVMGASLSWLTQKMAIVTMLPLLMLLILLFLLCQQFLPRRSAPLREKESGGGDESIRDSLALIWNTRHLRIIAFVVIAATMASSIVDFQFKEYAQIAYAGAERANAELTGFFGAFYGWTGAIAMLIQLLVAGRLIGRAGIGPALAVLPILLILGSASFALLPGLLVITLTRGADNSLRKSLFRPTMEFLFVPLPDGLRKRTKTFLDSFADSLAEGLGAGLVFLWVTLFALPSRWLSLFAILLGVISIGLSRKMDRQYLRTIVTRLNQEEQSSDYILDGRLDENRLLSATFTRLNVRAALAESGELEEFEKLTGAKPAAGAAPMSPRDQMRSPVIGRVLSAMERVDEWDEAAIAALINLLARDALLGEAVARLSGLGERAVPQLAAILADESADFVIRRRVPQILSLGGGSEADDALLDAMQAKRFEVRYRSVIALSRRRKSDLPLSTRNWREIVWDAIETEVARDRPVWELQKLLDERGNLEEDELVSSRVGARGELSLEHTFRMLSLVLDPQPVRAAFHGVTLEDDGLKSFAQEYLEQVLPGHIRKRLWLFIGDSSERQKRKDQRPMGEVISDLMSSRATLFGNEIDQAALRRLIDEQRDED